jgi:iron complex transport system ATP-binding protein
MNDSAAFLATGISVQVPGRELVTNLTLDVRPSEMLAVLGQNGAGKSLTLLTLAGIRAPSAGAVRLNGQPIESLNRRVVARALALLPQDDEDIFPASVLDTALIGRHPHIGRFGWESGQDHDIATRSLQLMDLGDMLDRNILTLSGGERRRLAIAQVLTQAPGIYLLDEPTNHLDPQHQLHVMHVFAEAARNGAAVVANLHDVNLASRFADRCLLLYGDGTWEAGATGDVLTADRLERLFGTAMEPVPWRGHTLFVAERNQRA